MKAKQLDITGKTVGEISLEKEVFDAELQKELLAQAVHVHRKRAYVGTKKTKNRGEVRGGGKKPWRQKGTGRARHGSIRSPLWIGGGAHTCTRTNW